MKKTLVHLIILVLALAPVASFAQQPPGFQGGTAPYTVTQTPAPQALGARQGVSPAGSAGSISNAAAKAGNCATGQLLAGGLKSYAGSLFASVATGPTVPTTPVAQTIKETGMSVTGGISLDAIGFCLVNALIEYIGEATVQWINSGFQGNPVFVEDPARFFAGIADIEAGNFLGELSGGFLCSPLQLPVRINLATQYNNSVSSFSNRAKCTFTGIAGNLENFMSGQSFSWGDWASFHQNPYNNPYGAGIYAGIELDRRIASALGVESKLLDWGRGFLSFKDPETGEITSPGTIIEKQVNQRLGSGERRLEIADEFDEIVNALINQLIKIALSEVTSTGGGGGFSYEDDSPEIPPDEFINAKCSAAELNTCDSGEFSEFQDTDDDYIWYCMGQGGGKSVACLLSKETLIISCSVDDAVIEPGEETTFAASSAGGEEPIEYVWNGPGVTDQEGNSFIFSSDVEGTFEYEVVGTDNENATYSATCSVTVEQDNTGDN